MHDPKAGRAMSESYRVEFFQDNIYEVLTMDATMPGRVESVFQGSLADCEAYIRLKQSEGVDF